MLGTPCLETGRLTHARLHHGDILGNAGQAGLLDGFQDTLVVLGHDFHEQLPVLAPTVQDPLRYAALRIAHVVLEQPAHGFFIMFGRDPFEVDHIAVAAARKDTVGIIDVGFAARHAGREITPGPADDDDAPAGHVFATVIADALDHGDCTGVAHREPLAGNATEIGLATGCPVERDVADQDVLLSDEARMPRRIDHDAPAGETLADVIVGIALERHRNAVWYESTETLPAEPLKCS